jgi:hypothetical protein
MTTRVGNPGAAVTSPPPPRVETHQPVMVPSVPSQTQWQPLGDGFEGNGVRHDPFQSYAGSFRADLPKLTVAELMRTGSASVPSTAQAEQLVKEAYAEALLREPDAGGGQMYKDKALEMARNGATPEEIKAFLLRELTDSPEGQVVATIKHPEEFLEPMYQRLLGRSVDGEAVATFGARMKEMHLAGASLEDIQSSIEQDIQASPEYQTRQAQQTRPSTPTRLQGITPSQISDAAGFSDQWSLCGPIAAVAASRAMGKPVSLEEARSVALQGGNYTPGAGMHGAESEVRLLKDLGIASHTESPVNWDTVKQQLQSGRPVIISTPNHYFVIEGYNAQTGKFDCGNSALAMKASGGTQTELSPEELAAWGGGAPTAIILD